MPLTLEERERRAYITNSPDHSLIVAAIEADEEVREERDEFEKLYKEADDKATKAEGELEELQGETESQKDTIFELKERVEELEAVIEMAS